MRSRWSVQEGVPRTLLIALLLGSAPALVPALAAGDGGKSSASLPLSDLDRLIAQAPALKAEVDAALGKINKAPDAIVCLGNRFPSAWVHLTVARVAPYSCNFDGQWLTIEAEVHVARPDGTIYAKITPTAMQNAARVIETHPLWRWSAHAPALE